MFGAVWGIGEGLQGKSYAIPTMEGLENLAPAIQRFTSFAKQHKELKFFVTAIGCGIAGYQPEEIAPLFWEALFSEIEESEKAAKYYRPRNHFQAGTM